VEENRLCNFIILFVHLTVNIKRHVLISILYRIQKLRIVPEIRTDRSEAENSWLECGVVGDAMPCDRERYINSSKTFDATTILKENYLREYYELLVKINFYKCPYNKITV
jgi:hypothetical protein